MASQPARVWAEVATAAGVSVELAVSQEAAFPEAESAEVELQVALPEGVLRPRALAANYHPRLHHHNLPARGAWSISQPQIEGWFRRTWRVL